MMPEERVQRTLDLTPSLTLVQRGRLAAHFEEDIRSAEEAARAEEREAMRKAISQEHKAILDLITNIEPTGTGWAMRQKIHAEIRARSSTQVCAHPDFDAHVKVIRIEDTGQFMAQITVNCMACKRPFRFCGEYYGLAWDRPAMSPDGEELRAPIEPSDGTLFAPTATPESASPRIMSPADGHYLPFDCPVCGRHRLLCYGNHVECEKCETSDWPDRLVTLQQAKAWCEETARLTSECYRNEGRFPASLLAALEG